MEEFNYTIIIPHKSIPKLLQRCLDSIPERPDVQVIVVDDNSDPTIVDFENFPGKGRMNTEIYLTKEGKGAGYARNVGLRHAKGKWLLFADADDYYTKDAFTILDKYKGTDVDIVFYNVSTDKPNTPCYKTVQGISDLLHLIAKGEKEELVEELKYKKWVPWNKMFNSEYINKYQLSFEELFRGNDIQFSLLASYFASRTAIELGMVYIYTYNNNSISFRERNASDYIRSIGNMNKINRFYKYIKRPDWCSSMSHSLFRILKNEGFLFFVEVLYSYIRNWKIRQRTGNKYVRKIEEIKRYSFLY